MSNLQRWRGLSALIGDAVEHGATAVERIHMATARRPFQIIEQIPPIAVPTKLVHGVHDAIVTNTYNQIRWVNSLVQKVVQTALADETQAPNATQTSEISDKT
jgi:alpha-beta hydrolase superfamily lysophospholipase